MHEEGGELHHVPPAAAGVLEGLLDLAEHRAALRLEALAGRDHPGDVERLAALHAGDVGVGADGLAERVDVIDLDLGHRYLGLDWGLPRAAIFAFTVATSSARRTGLW